MTEKEILDLLQGKWRSEDGKISFEINDFSIENVEGVQGITSTTLRVKEQMLKAENLWPDWHMVGKLTETDLVLATMKYVLTAKQAVPDAPHNYTLKFVKSDGYHK